MLTDLKRVFKPGQLFFDRNTYKEFLTSLKYEAR